MDSVDTTAARFVLRCGGLLIGLFFWTNNASGECTGTRFPAGGAKTVAAWRDSPVKSLTDMKFQTDTITAIQNTIKTGGGCTLPANARWALFRWGRLIHVQGNFNEVVPDLKSARKTIHGMNIGALMQLGAIKTSSGGLCDNGASTANQDGCLNRNVWSTWGSQLGITVPDQTATLRHVLTQTSTFADSGKTPGQEWHYSDCNPPVLSNIALRADSSPTNNSLVWTNGTANYYEDAVLGPTLTNRIGVSSDFSAFRATGGSDCAATGVGDGIRIRGHLSDLGRLAVLMANDGKWNGNWILPRWYAKKMSEHQTNGIPCDVANGCYGPNKYSAYSFMTLTNAFGQYLYPGRSTRWATASGNGGHYILWNSHNGIAMVILNCANSANIRCIQPLNGRPGGAAQLQPLIDVLESKIIAGTPAFVGTCTPL